MVCKKCDTIFHLLDEVLSLIAHVLGKNEGNNYAHILPMGAYIGLANSKGSTLSFL
jgi:hypothetical protein